MPALRGAWTISEDGKTYTFTLGPNVKFHHGVLTQRATKAETTPNITQRFASGMMRMRYLGRGKSPPPRRIRIRMR